MRAHRFAPAIAFAALCAAASAFASEPGRSAFSLAGEARFDAAALESGAPSASSSGFEAVEAGEPLALGLPLFGRKSRAADSTAAPAEPRKKGRRARPARSGPALSPERARILLQSLTVPGWGQATLHQNRAAAVFLTLEGGTWGSYLAFRIQERLRRDTYVRTARDLAGIDLKGHSEEYHRMVGSFLSSDEYNLFVVYRDAANQFYDQPDAYWAYIAAHELKGSDTWAWPDVPSLLRYRAQRKDAQRAAQRANTALACAIGNRLLSMVHAARAAGRAPAEAGKASWRIEAAPAPGDDASAFRFALTAKF